MLNKTRKKYKGGALVGQGTYGCGFFPGLQCSKTATKSKSPQNKVLFSKFMTIKDAIQEFEINDIIRKIDPEEKYSIYPYKMCNLESKDYDKYKKDGLRSCKLIPNKRLNTNVIHNINDGKFKLLQSSYGGPTLYSIINRYYKLYNSKEPIDRKQQFTDIMYVLDGLENIFKGLVHYHEHDFAHLDIKDDNIVISSDSSSPKCKFIDFGLSNLVTKFNKIYEDVPEHIPVDQLILIHWSKIFNENHTMNIPHKFIKIQVENMVGAGCFPMELIGSYYDTEGNLIHNAEFIVEKYINILSELYTYNDLNSKTVSDEVKYLILTGVDVYSLGYVLSRALYFMLDIKMHYEKIFNMTNQTEIKDSDTVLPLSILNRLYNLIKGMTDINPFTRYSAEEAAEVYSEILFVLRNARSWGITKKSRKGFVVVNKNKTRKSIKKLEKILLSKSQKIALEPYLSSDVIDDRT